jgi:hypothetical protein
MSAKFEPLSRRAVACKGWRWMPGMLSDRGLRVTRCDRDGYVVGYYADLSYLAECVQGSLPDLSDPATVGCLVALVREAWKEAELSPTYYDDGTWCVGWPDSLRHRQASEAEALVAALEAAQ